MINEKTPFPEFVKLNRYNEFVIQDMKRDLKLHANDCEYCLSHIPCDWVKSFLNLFAYIESNMERKKGN